MDKNENLEVKPKNTKSFKVRLIAIITSAVVLCAGIVMALVLLLNQKVNVYLHIGTEVESQEIDKGSVFKAPTNIDLAEGEIFDGWYIDEAFTEQYDFSKKVEKDLHLYLKTSMKSINLVFASNEPTGETSLGFDFTQTVTKLYGETYQLTTAIPTLSTTDYVFKGWRVGNDINVLNPGDTFTVESSDSQIIISAVWEENQSSITISYVSNEPEGTTASLFDFSQTSSCIYGSTYQLPSDLPVLDSSAYSFKGWKVGESETLLNPGESFIVKSGETQIVITAVWNANIQTVHFNLNGAEGSIADVQKVVGEVLTLPDTSSISKLGYTFAGWATKKVANVEEFLTTEDQLKLANFTDAEVTLYAQWSLTKYTITFTGKYDTINGSETTSYTMQYNVESNITLPTATREYYDFTGWKVTSSESDLENASWTNATIYSLTDLEIGSGHYGDVSLALQTEGMEMRLIFSAPDGQKELINAVYPNLVDPTDEADYIYVRYNGSISTAYYKDGTTAFSAMPTVDNMDGNGWLHKTSGTTKVKFGTQFNVNTADLNMDLDAKTVTLRAIFKEKSFRLYDDQNTTQYVKVQYGLTTTLPTPTSDLYTFVGWYSSAEGGSLVYAPGAQVTVTDTTTVDLYARWE